MASVNSNCPKFKVKVVKQLTQSLALLLLEGVEWKNISDEFLE